MNPAAQHAFDDSGEPILAVEFDYPGAEGGESGSDPSSPCPDALRGEVDALRHGLLVIIADGHGDATRLRAVALARLAGLYQSDAQAARAIGVNRSTVHRAVRRMRQKLQAALRTGSRAKKPCKHGPVARR